MTPLQKARAELRDITDTMEYAWAFGYGATVDHPRLRRVRQRVYELRAIIAEHSDAAT